MKWFWKTLFGYTVVRCDLETETTFKHRPFRIPEITHRRKRTEINGERFDYIFIDDDNEIPREVWQSLGDE